jgi:hypothetical protein
MSPTTTIILLLVGMLLGALAVAGGVAAGAAIASRRTDQLERRFDKMMGRQQDEAARQLNLLLSRDPATFGLLEAGRVPGTVAVPVSGSDEAELDRWLRTTGEGVNRGYDDPNDIPDSESDEFDIVRRALGEG